MPRKINMENLAKPLAVSLGSYAFYRWARSGSASDISKAPGPGGNTALIGETKVLCLKSSFSITFLKAICKTCSVVMGPGTSTSVS